jgi:peptide/nickel transport system permease protein
MRIVLVFCQNLGRTLLLLALVAMGTIALMRFAPGYFSDSREMDAKYAERERSVLQQEQAQQGSLSVLATGTIRGWFHGDLGSSRQYGVPVSELVRPRLRVTAMLLFQGVLYGWLLAVSAAFPASLLSRGTSLAGLPFTLLLAIPTGAMATLCLLANAGGPVLVLTLLVAARDFKFLQRLLRSAWTAPHLLHARARGIPFASLARAHVLRNITPQITSLATLSLVTALSAIVPLEVIFDVPGVGQLAWSAAMNRDMPVLVSITLLMALMVSCAGMLSPGNRALVQTA